MSFLGASGRRADARAGRPPSPRSHAGAPRLERRRASQPLALAPLLDTTGGGAMAHTARCAPSPSPSPSSTRMSGQPSPHERRPDDGEAALLERMRRGDRVAFAAIVDRHAPALLRVARSLLGDASAAEEVVQETWIALLTGLAGFEGRASVRTWLFRVLVNKARTRFHRDGRTVPFSALGDEDGRSPAAELERFASDGAWAVAPGGWAETDPEQLALGAETRAAIEAAIRELPDAQRAVLTLRDVEGLETEEICHLLGVTVSNQRVLLHRARVRVREALAHRLERKP